MLGNISLVIELWMHEMELPQYVVEAETVTSFKVRLDKFHHKF